MVVPVPIVSPNGQRSGVSISWCWGVTHTIDLFIIEGIASVLRMCDNTHTHTHWWDNIKWRKHMKLDIKVGGGGGGGGNNVSSAIIKLIITDMTSEGRPCWCSQLSVSFVRVQPSPLLVTFRFLRSFLPSQLKWNEANELEMNLKAHCCCVSFIYLSWSLSLPLFLFAQSLPLPCSPSRFFCLA